ncbi:hypothetical protein B9Z55_023253 [Caenorhabditis nigoni]|uniref:G-protein coupled receptors family 1 profile domain-containing protein n=1 Tax=Caenorhabditis nigoni TaxID=1611254 RepID=A0A2G5SPK1_9PELO|nr:hypothetical protein B9Z55_023253 [Caenorhabditis nigoni]
MFGRLMEASDNSTLINPVAPTYLISDYIEIAYLGLVLLFGVPANVIILKKLIAEWKTANRDMVKSGFVLLKINLNITDLLILTYSLGKLIWLITYRWVGGDYACRFYQMFSMFSLYSSSNIVMCIALDRLRNVIYANQIHTKSSKVSLVHILAWTSWIAALLCSIPQYFFFQTIEVYPDFVQCTDVWQIRRHFDMEIRYFAKDSFFLTETFENLYNILHLVVKCCTEKKKKSQRRNEGKDSATSTASARTPMWRKQMRSRVFRTTMLVIFTHFLFWFPYNALGGVKYISQGLFEVLSANANIFKDLQILITLINPFLYGFSSGN